MWFQWLHWNVIVWNYVQLKCFLNKNLKESNCREGGRAVLNQQASHPILCTWWCSWATQTAVPSSCLPPAQNSLYWWVLVVLPGRSSPPNPGSWALLSPVRFTCHCSRGFPQTYNNTFVFPRNSLERQKPKQWLSTPLLYDFWYFRTSHLLCLGFVCSWKYQVLGCTGTVGLWLGFSSPNPHKHNLVLQTYLNKVL